MHLHLLLRLRRPPLSFSDHSWHYGQEQCSRALLDPGVLPTTEVVAHRSIDFLWRPNLLRTLRTGTARGHCYEQ